MVRDEFGRSNVPRSLAHGGGEGVFAVRLASSPGVASLRGVYIWRGGWFPGGQPLFSLPWSGYRGLLVVQALPSSLYF